LKGIDFSIKGEKIEANVVTGLDSLQRESDADSMLMFLGDLGQVATLPEPVLMRLKLGEFIKLLASNRRVDAEKFIKEEQQLQQEMQQQQMQSAPQEQPQAPQ